MSDDKEMMAAALAGLCKGYMERLPAELEALNGLAARFASGETDSALLSELHHRLHKLAGSGGTFGLQKLTERSRELEYQVKGWLKEGSVPQEPKLRFPFVAGIEALGETVMAQETVVVVPSLDNGQAMAEGRPIQVWLVEDDEPLGRELARLLRQFGFAVRLFTSLAHVEAALREGRPDVMILDVLFPAEGSDATEELALRSEFRRLDCPIIFITAYGGFESRVRAARLGAEGFLLKPIDVPKLVDRLEGIFAAHHATPYRVLIVDDDVTLAQHYSLILRGAGMETECVTEPKGVIERISAFQPELVLMDMHMPGYSGPELATVIRQYDEWLGLPIVYLSAETDLDEQIRAMGQGGDDFLTKPISDTHLVAAVRVRAARARQLGELMSKDSLTGLLKHARIKEELVTELARARRSGKPFCVVMVDIDHFKRVNDNYGHPVGDRVIRAVAQLLKQRLRKSDAIGRYGGEEFAILLPECDETMARDIMDDIRERFAELRFNHDRLEFSCTLSAGIACSTRFPTYDGSELLNAADSALYSAKHGGRNRVELVP